MSATRDELLASVPDEPRFVEPRGLLLANRCRIVGGVDNAVLVDAEDCLMVVLGRPLLLGAEAALAPAGTRILVPDEEILWVAAALPDWEPTTAHVFTRTGPPTAAPLADVRLLDAPAFDHLIPEFRDELERALARGPMSAVIADGVPVSFCYAGVETETLWDVSIDTLEPYRRRGFAAAAFEYLAAHYAGRGKVPVWGALETNLVSLRLARARGFTEVATLDVLSRRG